MVSEPNGVEPILLAEFSAFNKPHRIVEAFTNVDADPQARHKSPRPRCLLSRHIYAALLLSTIDRTRLGFQNSDVKASWMHLPDVISAAEFSTTGPKSEWFDYNEIDQYASKSDQQRSGESAKVLSA
jgi:hypothetical protein